MEKRVGVSAKYIQKKCILGKIQWPKITFGAKCNGESVEVSAKYIQKKAIWAKYNGQKLHFGRKCNKESVEVSAKHIQKNALGKIQWRKIAFGVRYNGEKV